MIKTVPFVPLGFKGALRFSRFFIGIGGWLEKLTPRLGVSLSQAEFGVETREYLAVALFSMIFWFSIIFSSFAVIGTLSIVGKLVTIGQFLFINAVFSSIIAMLSFVYILLYPRFIVTRRIRNIEKNLLYGLRDMSVQVRSGVPLFEALVSLSRKDYGKFSDECKICVTRISTGWSAPEALEEMTMRNPSRYFRRSMWQLTNTLRSGGDMGSTLDSVVRSISDEQRVEIRKYGAQLNPLVMMYMMLGVIIPSLGITLLIILSSFSGIPVTKTVFWFILVILMLFQFAFIGIVKSRRPSIEI